MTTVRNHFSIAKAPALFCWYAYIDTVDRLADSLFEQEGITVRKVQEFENKVNYYTLVICKVLPWHREGFLKALDKLPDKMCLLGFRDYDEFCREYLDYSENWLVEKEMKSRERKEAGDNTLSPCLQ